MIITSTCDYSVYTGVSLAMFMAINSLEQVVFNMGCIRLAAEL